MRRALKCSSVCLRPRRCAHLFCLVFRSVSNRTKTRVRAARRDAVGAGIMQSMVTITHNNRCPEMLAAVRRGPFAKPTQEEKIEFLLTRVRKSDCRVAFADHALEHTLSFQRRVAAIKLDFLRRGVATPLGITQDPTCPRVGGGPCCQAFPDILVYTQLR